MVIVKSKEETSIFINYGNNDYIIDSFGCLEEQRDKTTRIIYMRKLSPQINELIMLKVKGINPTDFDDEKLLDKIIDKLVVFFNKNVSLFFGSLYLQNYPYNISIHIDLSDNSFNLSDYLENQRKFKLMPLIKKRLKCFDHSLIEDYIADGIYTKEEVKHIYKVRDTDINDFLKMNKDFEIENQLK